MLKNSKNNNFHNAYNLKFLLRGDPSMTIKKGIRFLLSCHLDDTFPNGDKVIDIIKGFFSIFPRDS